MRNLTPPGGAKIGGVKGLSLGDQRLLMIGCRYNLEGGEAGSFAVCGDALLTWRTVCARARGHFMEIRAFF